jgi:hypothetical protein
MRQASAPYPASALTRSALVASAILALVIAAPPASPQATAVDTKQMVLRLGDLPAGFRLEQGRYVSNAQALKESPGKDYVKLGRITGYEAEFVKEGSPFTGILRLSSNASTYKTPAGAHASFRASVRAGQTSTPRFRRLSLGAPLGHEARLLTATVMQNGVKVDVYTVLWRSGNVFASLFAGALAGTGDPAKVVSLAKKQQRRIVAATR